MRTTDAIAAVAARSHYTARAHALEEKADEAAQKGQPLTARSIRYKARIAQRAAIAELVNPETR